MQNKFKAKKDGLVFEINSKLYPFDAILNTAYIFIDRCYVSLDGNPTSKIKINLKGKNRLSSKQLLDLKGEFNNELLNQVLRDKIAKNSKKIREYIVTQALFSAAPNKPENDAANASDEELDKMLEKELKALEEEEKKDEGGDPLGILNSWEINNAKKNKSKLKKLKK